MSLLRRFITHPIIFSGSSSFPSYYPRANSSYNGTSYRNDTDKFVYNPMDDYHVPKKDTTYHALLALPAFGALILIIAVVGGCYDCLRKSRRRRKARDLEANKRVESQLRSLDRPRRPRGPSAESMVVHPSNSISLPLRPLNSSNAGFTRIARTSGPMMSRARPIVSANPTNWRRLHRSTVVVEGVAPAVIPEVTRTGVLPANAIQELPNAAQAEGRARVRTVEEEDDTLQNEEMPPSYEARLGDELYLPELRNAFDARNLLEQPAPPYTCAAADAPDSSSRGSLPPVPTYSEINANDPAASPWRPETSLNRGSRRGLVALGEGEWRWDGNRLLMARNVMARRYDSR